MFATAGKKRGDNLGLHPFPKSALRSGISSVALFSPTPSRAPRRSQRRLTEPRRIHRRAGGGATGAPSRKARNSESGIRRCRSSYDQNLRWAPPWTARPSWPQPPWPGFCCREENPRENIDQDRTSTTTPDIPRPRRQFIRKSDYNSQHAIYFLQQHLRG